MFELVDIGANLTTKSFAHDLPAVLQRAHAAGVSRIVVTGTSVEVSRDAAALAQSHGLFSTAGIHPHHASQTVDGNRMRADVIDELRELARQPGVVALGECGLDYNRNFSPPEAQRQCFEAQLALAAELGLPLFLHERDAHDDFHAIVRNARAAIGRGVIHCFTGSRVALDAYLSLDLHVGITGWICDERRGHDLQQMAHAIPVDRLMIETDAPYLLPRTMPNPTKERRNEPAFLSYVLHTLAHARQQDAGLLAQGTTATARAFFNI